jgi:hypothetical protein
MPARANGLRAHRQNPTRGAADASAARAIDRMDTAPHAPPWPFRRANRVAIFLDFWQLLW